MRFFYLASSQSFNLFGMYECLGDVNFIIWVLILAYSSLVSSAIFCSFGFEPLSMVILTARSIEDIMSSKERWLSCELSDPIEN